MTAEIITGDCLEVLPVIKPVRPIVDQAVRSVCRAPYPGHPRGCPGWGRPGCPPGARPIHRLIDISEVLLVAVPFNLAKHVDVMRIRHPNWTNRQLRNLLYWQGGVRIRLKRAAAEVRMARGPGWVVVECPEACGVNLTETAAQAGIVLEWPPRITVWKIALVGRAVDSSPGPRQLGLLEDRE